MNVVISASVARRNLGLILTLVVCLISSNFVFFSIPAPVVAQGSTRSTSRITVPLASNANLVVENSAGTESHTVLISDSLTSTKVVLSFDGTTTATPHYYPYGTLLASQTDRTNETNTTNRSNRYYTGQRKLPDTNIYNYNARYYNPDIGLFTQPDSIQGPNRFAYVGGNPTLRNDPSGIISTDTRGPSPDLQQVIKYTSQSNRLPLPGNPMAYTDQIWQSERNATNRDMLAVVLGAPIGAIAGYGGYAVGLAATTACMGSMVTCRALFADMLVGEGSLIPVAPVPVGPASQTVASLGIELPYTQFGTNLDQAVQATGDPLTIAANQFRVASRVSGRMWTRDEILQLDIAGEAGGVLVGRSFWGGRGTQYLPAPEGVNAGVIFHETYHQIHHISPYYREIPSSQDLANNLREVEALRFEMSAVQRAGLPIVGPNSHRLSQASRLLQFHIHNADYYMRTMLHDMRSLGISDNMAAMNLFDQDSVSSATVKEFWQRALQ